MAMQTLGKVVLVALAICASATQAHIRINPTESVAGGREMYRMRVPNEKQVNSSRIEGEFPAGLKVYAIEPKAGWTVTLKKNDKGDIVGATWTGALKPYEFLEFGMLATNPQAAGDLSWKFVQYYDDGTKEEFIGAAGSRLPAPVVTLKAAPKPQ
jgi:uncharacterized protein YcnI